MSIIKKTKFLIKEINQQTGNSIVQYINPYGVIETGQKTLDDFKQIIDIPTGSFELDGTPITTKKEIFTNDNPNEDLILSIDIPVDANGDFIAENELLEHIAKHYPQDIFDDREKRKKAKEKEELSKLVGTSHEIDLIYNNQPQSFSAPPNLEFDVTII
jgi:hypothetical protein